jgi:hypothetical protein
MMFPGWGMGGWMMVSYGFVVLLFLVGIVVALVALSHRTGRRRPTEDPPVHRRLDSWFPTLTGVSRLVVSA